MKIYQLQILFQCSNQLPLFLSSSYGKKYALGNLFLIDDTADADSTNSHGKSNAVNKIKQAAKPNITAEQLQKAREYIAAGGNISAIETKYKLTNEQKADITKAKK